MSSLSHMKYMLLGGAGVFVIALLAGVPVQSALLVGALLACPLMMVFMMAGHGGGHDDGHTPDPLDRQPEGQDGHSTPTRPM